MVWQLLFLFFLVLLNGMFAMAELALVGARRTRLKTAAMSGHSGAKAALLLLGDTGRFLSTVSIGITLIAVLVSTVGGDSFVEPLAVIFGHIPALSQYAHTLALSVVVATTSATMIVLGELVPKRLALGHPEAIAMTLARFMTWFARLARPIEVLLSGVSSLILFVIPLRSAKAEPVTDEEISLMMREGAETGTFHPDESAIVQMALKLDDRSIEAIMTPRTQIEFLDLENDWEANRRTIVDTAYSRFPVVEGGPDKLVGIVHVKDLLAQSLGKGEGKSEATPDLRRAMKSALFVPNTVTALRLLETLKQAGNPMALVVDEYGELEGLVTLDDILQALVGDIGDAGLTDDQEMVRREDGSWLVDGLTPIETVTGTLAIAELPGEEGEFHTLGGFMMDRLKRIPRVADSVDIDGWRFEVVDMDGHRVDKVLIAPRPRTMRPPQPGVG